MARCLIGLFVALSAALAACAEPEPQTLAIDSVVDGLAASIWPANPSVVTGASCPGLVELPIAQSTVCRARLHEDDVTLDVVVDEFGETAVSVRQPLFELTDAADRIRRRLTEDLGSAVEPIEVVCEKDVIVAVSGATVACIGDRAGDELSFAVELTDSDGGWQLNYVK